jgi:hypothetical protein
VGYGGTSGGGYGTSSGVGHSGGGYRGEYGRPSGVGYSGSGGDSYGRPSGVGYGGASEGGYGSMPGAFSGGSMRNRPPKGYTRSDERLREDICERLMHERNIDAGDVSVEVKDGKVTLEGCVTDRFMKHRIEDIAEECSGVKDVENRIRVVRDSFEGSRSAGQHGSSGMQPSSDMQSASGRASPSGTHSSGAGAQTASDAHSGAQGARSK